MANVLDEVLAANQTYAAEFGERGRLPLPPARRFAICMDARLDPAKFAHPKTLTTNKAGGIDTKAQRFFFWALAGAGWASPR